MPIIENLPQATSAADANVAVILQDGVTKKIPLSVLKTYFAGSTVLNEFDGDGPPGTDDDAADGYSVGSVWIDRTSSPMEAYRCVDATEGGAIWLNTTLEIGDLDSAFAGKADKVPSSPNPTGKVATFDENGNLVASEKTLSEIGSIGLTIDGGGSAIETGVKGYVTVPYACTITGWHLTGAPSGSIVIDVWKAAGAIPTVAGTITGTEKPTLSSAQVANDTNLTTWTTAVSAGDVIGFNVDSCSSVERATLVLSIMK